MIFSRRFDPGTMIAVSKIEHITEKIKMRGYLWENICNYNPMTKPSFFCKSSSKE